MQGRFLYFRSARAQMMLLGPQINYMPSKSHVIVLFTFISDMSRGPFLESPETLPSIFGCHNYPCVSRTEKIKVVKLHSHFAFCCHENMLKDGLSKTSGWHFHKWLSRARKVVRAFAKRAPGLTLIRCTRISVSITKCPLALLADFNIACVSECSD